MNRVKIIAVLLILITQITYAQKKTKPQLAAPKPLKAVVYLEKVNPIYVGIENPISISAGNASAAEISAICKKGEVKTAENGSQVLLCSKPGLDTLTVTAPDGTSNKFPFKLKKMPDPVAKLNGQFASGTITVAELRACNELKAIFEHFNYDPKCVISGFNFTYIPKKQEPVSLVSTSAKIDSKIAEQLIKAKPGDYYLFSNITTKCQGDISPRTISPLFFTIK
jgi:hypothetical protein